MGHRDILPTRFFVARNSSSNASTSLAKRLELKRASKERLDADDGAAAAGSIPIFFIMRTSPRFEAGM